MKKYLFLLGFIVFLVASCYVIVTQYSFVFAHNVKGKVVGIERVTLPSVVGEVQNLTAAQLFSFAVAIQAADGEIYTASSQDRRWAVVQKDQCVEARFFPYPIWNLEKSGTYFNARLNKIYTCP